MSLAIQASLGVDVQGMGVVEEVSEDGDEEARLLALAIAESLKQADGTEEQEAVNGTVEQSLEPRPDTGSTQDSDSANIEDTATSSAEAASSLPEPDTSTTSTQVVSQLLSSLDPPTSHPSPASQPPIINAASSQPIELSSSSS